MAFTIQYKYINVAYFTIMTALIGIYKYDLPRIESP